jgi:hypothetical protein
MELVVVAKPVAQALIVLALVACSKHEAPAPQPAPADCKAATDDIGKFLTTMDHDGSLISLEHVSPPVRRDLTIKGIELRWGPVVEVRTDDIYYQDQKADLGKRLAADHQKIEEDIARGMVPRHDPPDPRALIVVADDKAQWVKVVAALEAAHKAGFDHITFVFGRPPATPPPPRTKVEGEIEKLMASAESGNKATALANYIRPKIAPCPALVEVFGMVGQTEMEDKATYMLRSAGPAIAACNCAVDPAEMRSMFWMFVGNPKPTMLLRVELDPKAPPHSAQGTKTWGEESGWLTPDKKTIWLTAWR